MIYQHLEGHTLANDKLGQDSETILIIIGILMLVRMLSFH